LKRLKDLIQTKGVRFISYAIWWIKQSILQTIQKPERDSSEFLKKTTRRLSIKIDTAYLRFHAKTWIGEPNYREIPDYFNETVTGFQEYRIERGPITGTSISPQFHRGTCRVPH